MIDEQRSLFDLDDQADDDSCIDLRDDDTAWTSCRYCQTATTAAGIVNRGHGPDSNVCERMRAWTEVE